MCKLGRVKIRLSAQQIATTIVCSAINIFVVKTYQYRQWVVPDDPMTIHLYNSPVQLKYAAQQSERRRYRLPARLVSQISRRDSIRHLSDVVHVSWYRRSLRSG